MGRRHPDRAPRYRSAVTEGRRSQRFREPDDLPWRDPVLVVWPRCGLRATAEETGRGTARLLCLRCALSREWTGDRLHVLVDGRPAVLQRDHGLWLKPDPGQYLKDDEYVVPEARDSRFGVPLWLRTECCGGHLLWANNEAHLDYLESYIGATLRERPVGPSGLAWYLPAWMKQAKRRDEVLRALGHLRASLDQ
jgi:hypothetical protein